MKQKKIAVIGGGAAGMMAAITAADRKAAVTLYERNERVGKKLLSTGNGKCNFSNMDLKPCHYFGKDIETAWNVLNRFDNQAVLNFFHGSGMLTKEKRGGLYPAAEQASVVLDILRLQLKNKAIEVRTENKVQKLRPLSEGGIEIITEKSKDRYDSVILACGSKAAPKTGSDGNGYALAEALGHSLIPVVPALVQLRCGNTQLKSVAGVRAEAEVTLTVNNREMAKERGELQLTDYGISGIVVFQMSRIAAYALREQKDVTVYIDFLPNFSDEEYSRWVSERKASLNGAENVEQFFTGMLHKKLMLFLIRLAGLKPTDSYNKAPKGSIDKVFTLCRHLPLHITGYNSFDNAQVCAGGIPLCEVSENLESLKQKGIFFAGEMLDVDGKCGGYNLQWAWSSGYVAGKSAAERLI
ncbi:MAG: aminoacetone oxidase family FAD-binding enzyme [Lachnospiraceae bacterium]|nr:aminoacetone oxidase family FAD-binding enzyme [Lachnospiraceae bacterium]